MLRVNQDQLAQATNIDYVKIRNNELNYFGNFFSGFGVQIALIAGFNLNVISQTVSYGATCNEFWLYLYWINNSLGSIFGILAILIALLTNVFGQGLALRGPVGSMVRAIDGMVDEQKRFLNCFTLCIICTTLSLIGDFFIMMELPGAWAAGSIMFFGMFFWGHSCLRIYNRFYFSNEMDRLGAVDQIGMFNEEFRDSIEAARSPILAATPKIGAAGSKKQVEEEGDNDGDFDPTSPTSSLKFLNAGNLSIRSGSTWPRYYFVIKGRFGLYYRDKKAFEMSPMEPINNRPITLNEYMVDVKIDSDAYCINLAPADPEDNRKTWEFRVDTEMEWQAWRKYFEQVTAKGPIDNDE